ncbi:hypothetical protein [Undibacterium sp.]|uniref:hypothetical protein n=1 Tax=Undibacterium sp. TaxID=1914977 RepID=UPI00272F8449|nr:hypothetical protein [Undibacterium sp.]MDP1979369.1 hypothetical protein [Undibacterium sp.]
MKWIHIIAGLIAISSGAIAMFAAKGSPLHRKTGTMFTVSMLVMTASAAIISLFLRTDHVTGVAALFTAYLVCTSWLVTKRTVQENRVVLNGFAFAAAMLGVYALSLWFHFLKDPTTLITKNSPPQTLMVFGALSLLCSALDFRMLWTGQIAGAHRLVRHLWRMCFAMLIATASFFTGQMQVFPKIVRQSTLLGIPILAVPVLLVLVVMLYWMGRTLARRKRKTVNQVAES